MLEKDDQIAHGEYGILIGEIGGILSENCLEIQRKSWSNVPLKLLACIGFLCKVGTQLGVSPWNLKHLFFMFLAKHLPQIFNFA